MNNVVVDLQVCTSTYSNIEQPTTPTSIKPATTATFTLHHQLAQTHTHTDWPWVRGRWGPACSAAESSRASAPAQRTAGSRRPSAPGSAWSATGTAAPPTSPPPCSDGSNVVRYFGVGSSGVLVHVIVRYSMLKCRIGVLYLSYHSDETQIQESHTRRRDQIIIFNR